MCPDEINELRKILKENVPEAMKQSIRNYFKRNKIPYQEK